MGQTEYYLPFLQAHICPTFQYGTVCNDRHVGCRGDDPHRTVGASLNAAASLGKGHYSAFIVFL